MKMCRLWHRAHIYYASLEQRAYLDLNIWYDASTHSQLEFAQWFALQASLNKDRKCCNHLSCPLSMTYRTSFRRGIWILSDMEYGQKKKKKSCLRRDREHNFCALFSINSVPAAGYRLWYQKNPLPHGVYIVINRVTHGKETSMSCLGWVVTLAMPLPLSRQLSGLMSTLLTASKLEKIVHCHLSKSLIQYQQNQSSISLFRFLLFSHVYNL